MGTPTSRRSLEFQDRLKECPGEFDKIVIGIYTTRNDAESAECDMLQSYHVTDNNLFYNVFSGNITSNVNLWENKDWRDFHSKATSDGTKKGIAENDTVKKRSKRAKVVWDAPGYSEKRDMLGCGKGEKNGRSILTEDDVYFIRYTVYPILKELLGASIVRKVNRNGKMYYKNDMIKMETVCRIIADEYDMTITPIRRVIERKSWRHI